MGIFLRFTSKEKLAVPPCHPERRIRFCSAKRIKRGIYALLPSSSTSAPETQPAAHTTRFSLGGDLKTFHVIASTRAQVPFKPTPGLNGPRPAVHSLTPPAYSHIQSIRNPETSQE